MMDEECAREAVAEVDNKLGIIVQDDRAALEAAFAQGALDIGGVRFLAEVAPAGQLPLGAQQLNEETVLWNVGRVQQDGLDIVKRPGIATDGDDDGFEILLRGGAAAFVDVGRDGAALGGSECLHRVIDKYRAHRQKFPFHSI
jgi:hypothetical protein